MDQPIAGTADASSVESWSRQFVDGNETVLGNLLANWAPQIERRLVRKYRGIFAEDEIEQLVLDALYAAWIKRQMFDPEKSSLMTWLDRIVEHLLIDRAKLRWWKQRRQETSLAKYKDCELSNRGIRAVNSSEDDIKSVTSPEMIGLLNALAKLSQRERDVLLGSMDETINSRELARELCISPSTVRTYRQRAWEKILHALSAEEFRKL